MEEEKKKKSLRLARSLVPFLASLSEIEQQEREKGEGGFAALLPFLPLSEHSLWRMKGYYKVTARRASMEPASAAGGSGKKATGNSRGGDGNAAAAAAPALPGRPALANLINGTGVFAQETEKQLLKQQEAPPTKRQRTLWPTPGAGTAAAAGGGLQVRSGRIAAPERIRIASRRARLALPPVIFSL